MSSTSNFPSTRVRRARKTKIKKVYGAKVAKVVATTTFCNMYKHPHHQKRRERLERYFPSLVLHLPLEEILLKQVSPKSEKGAKKLVSVLATFPLVTETREKIAEAAGAGKVDEKSNSEYPENLA